MNGRVYDYNVGRFMSVDPFIQAPQSSQSINPYSYIMNNPMSGTDPSGYLKVCDTFIVCSGDQVNDDTFNKTITLGGGSTSNGESSDSQQSSTSSQETTEIGSQANTAQNEAFGNIQITQDTWKDYVNDEGNVRGAIDESVLSFFNIEPENRPENFEDVFASWSKFNQAIKTVDSKFSQVAGVATALAFRAKNPNGGKNYSQGRKFWQEPQTINGKKVYQRNDLFNVNTMSEWTRKGNVIRGNNIERMRAGNAPIGRDGRSIELHHVTQTENSTIAELTRTFHKKNTRVIHINPNTYGSGINRSKFGAWSTKYWQNRANDF
jgi:hypothetical protein